MARGTAAQNGTGRGREVAGIILLGLAMFIGLSVMSLQAGSGTLMGPCGATVGLGAYALCGIGAYLLAFGLGVGAVRCLQGRPLHLAFGAHRLRGFGPGGLIGEYGAELMVSMVGRWGAALFGAMGLSVSLVLTTSISMRQLGAFAARAGRVIGAGAMRGIAVIFPERGEVERERDEEPEAPEAEEDEAPKKLMRRLLPRLRGKQADDTLHEKLVEVDDEEELLVLEKKVEDKLDKKRGKKRDDEAQVVKLSEVEPAVLKASKQDGAPLQVIENEKTELSAAPQLAPRPRSSRR